MWTKTEKHSKVCVVCVSVQNTLDGALVTNVYNIFSNNLFPKPSLVMNHEKVVYFDLLFYKKVHGIVHTPI